MTDPDVPWMKEVLLALLVSQANIVAMLAGLAAGAGVRHDTIREALQKLDDMNEANIPSEKGRMLVAQYLSGVHEVLQPKPPG